MDLLDQLKSNKGTVSSALGKELALKVLKGDMKILNDAIKYVAFDLGSVKSKGVRAGAAKILEKVAEKQPELIACHLQLLKPALKAVEPQTRWMLMQVFGFCAKVNPTDSESVLHYAEQYLTEKPGVCLSGSVFLYLGRIGATSVKTANKVLPILDDAYKTASENEMDWIFEGFLSIAGNVAPESLPLLKHNAELQLDAKKKSTQRRAEKLLSKVDKVLKIN